MNLNETEKMLLNGDSYKSLPVIKTGNDGSLPTCPNCKHYNAMLGYSFYIEKENHSFIYLQCRDCSFLVVNETFEQQTRDRQIVHYTDGRQPNKEKMPNTNKENTIMKNTENTIANIDTTFSKEATTAINDLSSIKEIELTDAQKDQGKANGFKLSEVSANLKAEKYNEYVLHLNNILNDIKNSDSPTIRLDAFLDKINLKENPEPLRLVASIISGKIVSKSDAKIGATRSFILSELLAKTQSNEPFNYEPIELIEPVIKISNELTNLASFAETASKFEYDAEVKETSSQAMTTIFGTISATLQLLFQSIATKTADLAPSNPAKWNSNVEKFIMILVNFSQGKCNADGTPMEFRATDSDLAIYAKVATKSIQRYRNALLDFQTSYGEKGVGLVNFDQTSNNTEGGAIYSLPILSNVVKTAKDFFIESDKAVSLVTIKQMLSSKDFEKQIKALPEPQRKAIEEVQTEVFTAFEKLPKATVELSRAAKELSNKRKEQEDEKRTKQLTVEAKLQEQAQEIAKTTEPLKKAIAKGETSKPIDWKVLERKELYRVENGTANLNDADKEARFWANQKQMKNDVIMLVVLAESQPTEELKANALQGLKNIASLLRALLETPSIPTA